MNTLYLKDIGSVIAEAAYEAISKFIPEDGE